MSEINLVETLSLHWLGLQVSWQEQDERHTAELVDVVLADEATMVLFVTQVAKWDYFGDRTLLDDRTICVSLKTDSSTYLPSGFHLDAVEDTIKHLVISSPKYPY